jgi:hypothetical protein
MKNQASALQPSYGAIGTALSLYDYNCFVNKWSEETSFAAFREDVVFIRVEVLESYLEDLLNLKMGDEYLHISRDVSRWSARLFEISIIIFAVAMGCVSALFGASQTMAYSLTFLSIIPLMGIYYLSPRSTRRRMRFARVLSREISRRRGHHKDGSARGGISFGDFFIRSQTPGLHGAAKVIVH